MRRFARFSASLLLCLVVGLAVLPVLPAQAQADFRQVDDTVQRLMSLYSVPGASIALVKDGKVIYVKGYGVRNTLSGQPVTEKTLFAIGSVTKSFTALDVGQLVDAGKLDLDTPVIKYLPDFKLSDATATQQLTLRHLLSHTSGLPRSEDWYFNKTSSREQVIKDMANIPLTAPVGKIWQYNNQNFVLAGYLVEKVTGQTWEAYTRAHVFKPLGMETADFDVTDMQKSPDFASPHALDVRKGMQPIPFFGTLGAVGPAGSINASALDMSKYVQFQLGGGTVDGKPLVSDKMLQAMHTAQILIDSGRPAVPATAAATAPAVPAAPTATTAAVPSDPLVSNTGYGFAWITEDYRGYHLVTHDGAIDGFFSEVVLVPSANVGLVILANADKAVQFSEVARLSLTEWLLGLKPNRDLVAAMNQATGFDPAKLKAELDAARRYQADPAALQALVGDYEGPIGRITISLVGGTLHMHVESQHFDTDLIPFSASDFLANNPTIAGTVFTFNTDAEGTTTLLQGVYGQSMTVGQRLGKNVKSVEYKDPQGRYTFTVPVGLVAVRLDPLDAAEIKSTNPDATLIIGARSAGGGDLKTEVTTWIKTFDPSFAYEPVDVRDIPVNGVTWTQFLYQLPSQQILAVVATRRGSAVYCVTLQGKLEAIQALTPKFNALLLSFQIPK